MATVNITLLPLYSNHYMYKIYKEPVIKLNNFMRLRKKQHLLCNTLDIQNSTNRFHVQDCLNNVSIWLFYLGILCICATLRPYKLHCKRNDLVRNKLCLQKDMY